jgi:hypothetical protein
MMMRIRNHVNMTECNKLVVSVLFLLIMLHMSAWRLCQLCNCILDRDLINKEIKEIGGPISFCFVELYISLQANWQ